MVTTMTGLLVAASPSEAAPETTVTLRVQGCDGCVLTPNSVRQWPSGKIAMQWRGESVRVRSGTARFRIPTIYTQGMSLEIAAPWEKGNYGSQPLVTLSKGAESEYTPGDFEDTFCWKGTFSKSVTLRIKVARSRGIGPGPAPYVVPNGYLSSLPKPDQPPGHQDLPYCAVGPVS